MDISAFLNTLPDISPAEMEKRIARAHPYTIVLLRRGTASRNDGEGNDRIQQEHVRYLMRLLQSGKIVLNGPILADHEIRGVSIYDAGLEEAMAFAKTDPAVQAGYLEIEALPWMSPEASCA